METNVFYKMMSNYNSISEMFKMHSYNEIVTTVSKVLNLEINALESMSMGGYTKGKLSGAYQFIIEDLIKNIKHYDWIYNRLSDDESKRVFTKLIQFRIVPAVTFIREAYESRYHQYFNKEIISCDENEVFVDCGGFVGDTSEDFINQYGRYKRIYVYEPSDTNIEDCKKNLEKYENIILRNCGVGEKNSVVNIEGSGASSSFMGTGGNGENGISIISLDEDIKEPVSFIKMDIEGFEIPAIIGAKNHIKNDSPKLAICTYHVISDMWEIPKLIYSINKNYSFFYRHYQEDKNWETVLYAVPADKIK